MFSWTEVSASERFQALSGDEQEKVRARYFDDFVLPKAPAEFSTDEVRKAWDERTKPKERSWGEALKDTVLSLGAGAGAVGEGVGTLYGMATGDMENTARQAGKDAREFYKDQQSDTLKKRERERDSAIKSADGEVAKFGTAIKETVTDPALLSSFLTEQIPQLVGPAGIARTLGWGAKAIGAAAPLATKAAVGGAIGAGAAMQGADVGSGTYDDLLKLPEKTWQESEVYTELLKADVPADEAKRQVALILAREAAGKGAAVSVAAQALPGGASIERVLAGAATRPGGRLAAVGRAAAGEAISEGVEESGGKISANTSVQNVDAARGTFEGTGEAAGMGVIGGVGLGGAAGAMSSRASAPTVNEPPVPAADVPEIVAGPRSTEETASDILSAPTVDAAIESAARALDEAHTAKVPTPLERDIERHSVDFERIEIPSVPPESAQFDQTGGIEFSPPGGLISTVQAIAQRAETPSAMDELAADLQRPPVEPPAIALPGESAPSQPLIVPTPTAQQQYGDALLKQQRGELLTANEIALLKSAPGADSAIQVETASRNKGWRDPVTMTPKELELAVKLTRSDERRAQLQAELGRRAASPQQLSTSAEVSPLTPDPSANLPETSAVAGQSRQSFSNQAGEDVSNVRTNVGDSLTPATNAQIPAQGVPDARAVESAPVAEGSTATEPQAAQEAGPEVAQGAEGQVAPQMVERRADAGERKRVADMTPEERAAELLTSPVTRTANLRAFDEDESATPAPVKGYADGDNFKAVNEALGHDGADRVLRAMGRVFAEAAQATGARAYHRSGDEFLFRFESQEQADAFDRAAYDLAKRTTITVEAPDGTRYQYTNPGFSLGTGRDRASAELAATQRKRERFESGERAGPGRAPPGLSQVAPAGQQDRGSEGGRQDGRAVAGETTPAERSDSLRQPDADAEAAVRGEAARGDAEGQAAEERGRGDAAEGDGVAFRRGREASNGLTRKAFTSALTEAFGEKAAARLIDKGVIQPLDTQEAIPAHVKRFVRDGDTIYGFYDPKTDRTYAVLENLEPEMIRGLAMHEVGVHYGFERMLGAERYAKVMKRLDAMAKAGNKDVMAARESAERESADEGQVAEETLAYLVSNRPEIGWVREVIAAIKAFLYREFGIGASVLTVDDLASLAKSAVMHAGEEVAVSTKGQPAFHKAYHGSPHDFDRFELSDRTIGSGEGVQAYGYGLYFSSQRAVAEHYQRSLADYSSHARFIVDGKELDQNSPERHGASLIAFNDTREIRNTTKRWLLALKNEAPDVVAGMTDTAKKAGMSAAEYWGRLNAFVQTHGKRDVGVKRGRLYEVELAPKEDEYLDWDKLISEQSDSVKKGLIKAGIITDPASISKAAGEYFKVSGGIDRAVSQQLAEAGIPGVKYLDGSSRGEGRGHHNYVIFDDKHVEVKAKFARSGEASSPVAKETAPLSPSGPVDAMLARFGGKAVAKRLTIPVYDRIVGLGKFVPEPIKAGLVSDYGLTEEYIDRRTEAEIAQRKGVKAAERHVQALIGLDRAQSRVAYQWMNQKEEAGDKLLEQLPEKERAVLQELKGIITSMGEEAVQLGQLSPEAFERNKMAYLHRSYARFEMEEESGQQKAARARAIRVLGEQYRGRGLVDNVSGDHVSGEPTKGKKYVRVTKGGVSRYFVAAGPVPAKYAEWTRDPSEWEVRYPPKKEGGEVGMWRDFSPGERQRMGELDEVRFAVAKTLVMMTRDLETGRLLQWVGEKYGKDSADGIKVVDTPQGRALNTFDKDTWVKVPETVIPGTDVKNYGALAGKFIPAAMWNDIRQISRAHFNPLGEEWAAMLRMWKISKTALSPVTHANNILSNVILADMADVGADDLYRAMKVFAQAKLRKDGAAQDLLRRYDESGGDLGSYALTELQNRTLEPLLAALRKEVQGKNNESGALLAASALTNLLHGRLGATRVLADKVRGTKPVRVTEAAMKAMIDAYGAEDQFYRFAMWNKAVQEGKTDIEAGKLARKAFLDYKINAPWIQNLRATALPFVAFAYRAAPLVMEAAATKPWKLARYFAYAGALNWMGYLALGLGGDDEKLERQLMPEELQGSIWGVFPRLVRLPWNTDERGGISRNREDSPVFLDVRRWVPVGDVVDFGQHEPAIPIPATLFPAGPLALLGEIVANKSFFTNKPIVLETDTPAEKGEKIVEYLFKWAAPNAPWVPWSYSYDNIRNAGKGKTDAFGREQSMRQALVGAAGFKEKSYPADVLAQNLRSKLDHDLMELQMEFAKVKRQYERNGMSEAEFDAEVEKSMVKREKLMDAFAKKMGE